MTEFMANLQVMIHSVVANVMHFMVTSTAKASSATCEINGQPRPAEDCKGLFSIFVPLMIVFVIFWLVYFAFWLWMLIHAITNKIPDKTLWIILLIFIQITAVIYFFVVKRKTLKNNQDISPNLLQQNTSGQTLANTETSKPTNQNPISDNKKPPLNPTAPSA